MSVSTCIGTGSRYPARVPSVVQALGLVAAGTNNSRVAQLLRQLSEFYSRDASRLFVTRIAQGFNHMGKVCLSTELLPLRCWGCTVTGTTVLARGGNGVAPTVMRMS